MQRRTLWNLPCSCTIWPVQVLFSFIRFSNVESSLVDPSLSFSGGDFVNEASVDATGGVCVSETSVDVNGGVCVSEASVDATVGAVESLVGVGTENAESDTL